MFDDQAADAIALRLDGSLQALSEVPAGIVGKRTDQETDRDAREREGAAAFKMGHCAGEGQPAAERGCRRNRPIPGP